jgi:hypothetical protein
MDLSIIRWEGRISGIAFGVTDALVPGQASLAWTVWSPRLEPGEGGGKPPHSKWTLPALHYLAGVDWASFSRKYS